MLARRALEWLCSVTLFVLVAVTAIDVVGRYLLKAPLPQANEYVRALMAIVIFGGMPLVAADNAHLSAGFFEHLFAGRARRIRDAMVTAFATFASAAWTWQLARQALDLHGSQELLGTLPLRVSYIVWTIAALSAVATLLLAANLAPRRRP